MSASTPAVQELEYRVRLFVALTDQLKALMPADPDVAHDLLHTLAHQITAPVIIDRDTFDRILRDPAVRETTVRLLIDGSTDADSTVPYRSLITAVRAAGAV